MNCKPGDLARIVNSRLGNNDKLVRVIEPSPTNGQPIGTRAVIVGNVFQVNELVFCWVVEALGAALNKESGRQYRTCPIGDCYLRPIRDPGDDATDETLLWKRVPSPTKETA